MKRKNKALISLSTTFATFLILWSFFAPIHTQTIESKFTVGSNPGFDLTLGKLNFGKLTPGNTATRTLNIKNDYPSPTKTKIKYSGNIASHITVSENNFNLNPGESKNITFKAYASKNLEQKEYSGKITILTYKN